MNPPSDKMEMETETKKNTSPHSVSKAAPTDNDQTADKHAAELEQEIEEIRDNLGGLVSELDHRRHRLNPLNALSRYPWPVALGGVAVVGLVVGAVAIHNARAKERDSWVNRGKRLQSALRRAVDKPEKVAKADPNIGMKVLTTVATAVAAVAARQLASRFFARRS